MDKKSAIALAIEAMKEEYRRLAPLGNSYHLGGIQSGKSAHVRRTRLKEAISVLEELRKENN